MTALLALVRKELACLFGSPVAYVVLTAVAAVTALIFFDHLKLYNQILFAYATTTLGGFESDAIPEHINLRDLVFLPVMEQIGITLIAAVPLVTMRVFAEERSRGTDELLATSGLGPGRIVLGKFAVAVAFAVAMMAVAFVYPALAVERGGLGAPHLAAVFLGLTLHAVGLTAIGLVCSAFSSSQLVAAASAWALAFVLWDFGWMGDFVGQGAAAWLEGLALRPRSGGFAEGVVSVADALYFLALLGVGLALARFSFDLRRVGG